MPLIPTETVVESGLDATYTAADVGGDTIVNDGRTILHLKNTDAAPSTVTVTAENTSTSKPGWGDLAKANAQVVVPATDERFLGPFPPNAFGQVGVLSYSSVTALTIAVLRY